MSLTPKVGLGDTPKPTLVIRNCGELLTLAPGPLPRRRSWLRELGIVRDGAVAIAGDEILWTGPDAHLAREVDTSRAEVVDAGGRLVMPAFVDPHTHPVFAGNRAGEFAMRLEGRSYQEIAAAGGGILATVRATRDASPAALLESTRTRIRDMVSCGTTTIEVKSGYGLNLADEVKSLRVLAELAADAATPARLVPTFLGAHAVPPESDSASSYVEYLCAEVLPEVAGAGLARYCDCFMEEGYFDGPATRRLFAAARHHGLGLRLHADELHDNGGAVLASQLHAASADHLLCAGPDGIVALAASDTVAVLMPGTAWTLRLGKFAPARAMVEAGVAVALGSDFNPGTCLIDSMQAVIGLACLEMGLTPAEAISAATVNAAFSLDLAGRVGRLAPGMAAELIILDAETHTEIPFRLGTNLVKRVVHDGRVVI